MPMAKGDYGPFREEALYKAFREGEEQYHAHHFGRQLADKVYHGDIPEEDVERRINVACERNPKWKKEFVQYAFDKTLEFDRTYGTSWEPVYGKKR